MTTLEKFCKSLEDQIVNAYNESVTVEDAEKLAAKFLHGMLQVSRALHDADLSARMRKSGLKAVKAIVYTNAIATADKKPTEAHLEHTINTDKTVNLEQDALDEADANRDGLERYYNIFREAHIFFRGISKQGGFNG